MASQAGAGHLYTNFGALPGDYTYVCVYVNALQTHIHLCRITHIHARIFVTYTQVYSTHFTCSYPHPAHTCACDSLHNNESCTHIGRVYWLSSRLVFVIAAEHCENIFFMNIQAFISFCYVIYGDGRVFVSLQCNPWNNSYGLNLKEGEIPTASSS